MDAYTVLIIFLICVSNAGMAFLGFAGGKQIRILELHKHDYIVDKRITTVQEDEEATVPKEGE